MKTALCLLLEKVPTHLRAELLVQPIIGQLVGHVVGPAHLRDYNKSVTIRVETDGSAIPV